MSEWQQSSERAVLVARSKHLRFLAESSMNKGERDYCRDGADAITAALALADRAAEAERLLAEVRNMYIGVQQRRTGKGYVATEAELDAELARREQARAAHRNAAQQEGQGDGKRRCAKCGKAEADHFGYGGYCSKDHFTAREEQHKATTEADHD